MGVHWTPPGSLKKTSLMRSLFDQLWSPGYLAVVLPRPSPPPHSLPPPCHMACLAQGVAVPSACLAVCSGSSCGRPPSTCLSTSVLRSGQQSQWRGLVPWLVQLLTYGTEAWPQTS